MSRSDTLISYGFFSGCDAQYSEMVRDTIIVVLFEMAELEIEKCKFVKPLMRTTLTKNN